MVCWLPIPKRWQSPSEPGEWLKGMKGQMEPERTETFDVWLVIELRVGVFDVCELGWSWQVKQSNLEYTPGTL